MRTLLCSLLLLLATCCQAQQAVSRIDYRKADSMASLFPGHSLKNLYELSRKLTDNLPTEREKFRAIYRWVCHNIDNDYDRYRYIKQQRQRIKDPKKALAWTRETNARIVRDLIDHHKTVCTGYAFLVKDLSYHAGIQCEIVDGYGRNSENNVGGIGQPNHSWNAVYLDGQWYLCDATWSAGANDPATGRFIRDYDDAYFLTPPILFARKHFPIDPKWLLMDHAFVLHDFLNGPVTYAAAVRYQAEPVTPSVLQVAARRGSPVEFRFTVPATFAVNKVEIEEKQQRNEVRYRQEGNSLILQHHFRSKGKNTMHILFDSQYAFSYVVKVE